MKLVRIWCATDGKLSEPLVINSSFYGGGNCLNLNDNECGESVFPDESDHGLGKLSRVKPPVTGDSIFYGNGNY